MNSKNNKVLIITYHLDLGGVEKASVELANELSDQGYNVTLLSLYRFAPNKFFINKKVKVYNIFGFYIKGLDFLVSRLFSKKISKKIDKMNFDYILSYQAGTPHKIASLSSSKTVKYTWLHGIGFRIDSSYRYFNRVFCVSEGLKSHYKNDFKKFDINNVFVVHNSLNKDFILEKSTEIIEEIDYYTFVSIGRLSEEKRFDYMIRSFNILRNKVNIDVRLEIIGDGILKDELHRLIEDLKLTNLVLIRGFQKNPYKFLNKKNRKGITYLCTSSYEGYNIAMTEAAVMGLPIISTDVYGANELLNDGEFGIVTPINTTLENYALQMKKMIDGADEFYASKIQQRIDDIYFVESTKKLLEFMREDIN